MKRIVVLSVFIMTILFSITCQAEVKYKGFINVGGSVMKGDTYQYVMGCDEKIGFSLNTEHGVMFNVSKSRNDGVFFGGGIGFDYVNVSLDSFDTEELETKNILSNSVMAIPLYMTIKYIYNAERVSMVYGIRGGYYKWYRGHYINENAEAKDYKIPYQGSYMVGFSVGVRLPINDKCGNNKYGVNIMFNYDYMGANTKWQGVNIENNKVGFSVGFDF